MNKYDFIKIRTIFMEGKDRYIRECPFQMDEYNSHADMFFIIKVGSEACKGCSYFAGIEKNHVICKP